MSLGKKYSLFFGIFTSIFVFGAGLHHRIYNTPPSFESRKMSTSSEDVGSQKEQKKRLENDQEEKNKNFR